MSSPTLRREQIQGTLWLWELIGAAEIPPGRLSNDPVVGVGRWRRLSLTSSI